MPIIVWKDALSIGVKKIDDQHKELVDLLNLVYDHAILGDRDDIIYQSLLDVEKYVQYHFADEEETMLEFKYPDIEHHREEHRKLKNEVDMYIERYREGYITAEDISRFLQRWLLVHIAGHDRAIGNHISRISSMVE